MSLNEPGALYNATKAPDLQDVPIMAKCDPDAMVWQEQALKNPDSPPQLNPHPHQDGTAIPHHMGQGGSDVPQK